MQQTRTNTGNIRQELGGSIGRELCLLQRLQQHAAQQRVACPVGGPQVSHLHGRHMPGGQVAVRVAHQPSHWLPGGGGVLVLQQVTGRAAPQHAPRPQRHHHVPARQQRRPPIYPRSTTLTSTAAAVVAAGHQHLVDCMSEDANICERHVRQLSVDAAGHQLRECGLHLCSPTQHPALLQTVARHLHQLGQVGLPQRHLVHGIGVEGQQTLVVRGGFEAQRHLVEAAYVGQRGEGLAGQVAIRYHQHGAGNALREHLDVVGVDLLQHRHVSHAYSQLAGAAVVDGVVDRRASPLLRQHLHSGGVQSDLFAVCEQTAPIKIVCERGGQANSEGGAGVPRDGGSHIAGHTSEGRADGTRVAAAHVHVGGDLADYVHHGASHHQHRLLLRRRRESRRWWIANRRGGRQLCFCLVLCGI
mmetsp:Transcript_13375/g.18322  ORF Transcript_13375/g.18322 Transcript_13375/m.18322 type:complete len:415 (+) Transcript_13375:61-1305(+)